MIHRFSIMSAQRHMSPPQQVRAAAAMDVYTVYAAYRYHARERVYAEHRSAAMMPHIACQYAPHMSGAISLCFAAPQTGITAIARDDGFT